VLKTPQPLFYIDFNMKLSALNQTRRFLEKSVKEGRERERQIDRENNPITGLERP
jgi:hypothetical protein